MATRIKPAGCNLGELGRSQEDLSKQYVYYLHDFQLVDSGSVGMKDDDSKSERIEAIKNTLFKLPKVHLYALDAVIKHIKS